MVDDIGRCEPGVCLICDGQPNIQHYGCEECGMTWHNYLPTPCHCEEQDEETEQDVYWKEQNRLMNKASKLSSLAYELEHMV